MATSLDLTDKKYPSVIVQGTLLSSAMLYIGDKGPSGPMVASIVFVLALSALQAINHRFYYYFPGNAWAERQTQDWDTYTLYALTFFALLCFVWGVTSFVVALISAAFVILPGFLWRRFATEWVAKRITRKLHNDPVGRYGKCPKCGQRAWIHKQVMTRFEGDEIYFCVDGCKEHTARKVPIQIG